MKNENKAIIIQQGINKEYFNKEVSPRFKNTTISHSKSAENKFRTSFSEGECHKMREREREKV